MKIRSNQVLLLFKCGGSGLKESKFLIYYNYNYWQPEQQHFLHLTWILSILNLLLLGQDAGFVICISDHMSTWNDIWNGNYRFTPSEVQKKCFTFGRELTNIKENHKKTALLFISKPLLKVQGHIFADRWAREKPAKEEVCFIETVVMPSIEEPEEQRQYHILEVGWQEEGQSFTALAKIKHEDFVVYIAFARQIFFLQAGGVQG